MQRTLFHVLFGSVLLAVLAGHAQTTSAFGFAFSVGGGNYDVGTGVAVDGQGHVYTTGIFSGTADFDPGPGTVNLTSAGQQDVFVAKYNPAGALVWAGQLSGDLGEVAEDVAVDAYGHVYTTGKFFGTVDFDPGPGTFTLTGNGAMFVSKLDSGGNFVWARHLADGFVESTDVAVDGQGNVYTAGAFFGTADFDPGPGTFTLTSAGGPDVFVSKLDKNGTFVWAKRMGGTGADGYAFVAVDGQGNIYTAGAFASFTADFDPGPGTFTLTSAGGPDVFVSKLDKNGTFVWAKRLGGTGADGGSSVVVDGQGHVYTTGVFRGTVDFDPGPGTFTLTSAGGPDVFVSKLDKNGTFVWAKRMGGTGADGGSGVAVDGQGHVYTTGAFRGTVDFDPGPGTFTLTSAGGSDVFVSKLNKNGTFVWARRLGGTDGDGGTGVAVDGQGHVYTTGAFRGTADFDPGPGTLNLTSVGMEDMFVSKLTQPTIGDRVWHDRDGDGVQDAGEPGIAGVVVELWNGSVNVLEVQTTDATGAYRFVGPSEAATSYRLVFRLFQLPMRFTFTVPDAGGDDTLDSDADSSGSTPLFVLPAEHNLTLDAGLTPLPIGDRVWHDLDGNGVQDAGEPGIAGVVVQLLGNEVPLGEQITDATGAYRFEGPFDSSTSYRLLFYQPLGSTFTVPDAGGDDTRDSDADRFGGTLPFKVTGKNHLTLDAGLIGDPVEVGLAQGAGSTDGDAGPGVAVDRQGHVYTSRNVPGAVDFAPGLGTVNRISASSVDPSVAGDHGTGWDYKFLPGAACQPQFGAQVGDFDRHPHSIRNVSERETERSVICPIVRDTVTEHDLDIGVTVTTGVQCSFHIMNYKGDQVADVSPSETHSVDFDRVIHYFLVKADPNIDPYGFVGYYALYCTLPPGAEVFSYGSGELAETTDYGE